MKAESFKINSENLEDSLAKAVKSGMTEFTLQDSSILNHKGRLIKFLNFVERQCKELFLTLPLSAEILDMDVCRACSQINCSIEIPLAGESKNGAYLFDKKFYSRRAQTLNTLGLVFGFELDFARSAGDSVKLFRDRLNFAVSLYPNHIDFPQLELFSEEKNCGKKSENENFRKSVSSNQKILEEKSDFPLPKPTSTFSTQDIKMTMETAFACQVFYTFGRAVTWFLAVLKPLKMTSDKFFKDFAEWQNHSSCGLDSKWSVDKSSHREIEKMQLEFLKFKYAEKNKDELFEVVSNVVRLNGALSRLYGEGEESVLELSYNLDELLGGGAMDIQSFFDNSFMENSRVKVFFGENGEAEYRYC